MDLAVPIGERTDTRPIMVRRRQINPFPGIDFVEKIAVVNAVRVLFHKDKKILVQRLAGLVLGLAIYITLPLRAVAHPPVNWGNPVTPEKENFAFRTVFASRLME